jgi:S-adenosylmethionine:tRNA ribosyltransferase-isomerase
MTSGRVGSIPTLGTILVVIPILKMNISDFDYTLPEELIAHYPAKERTASRLLVLNGQETLDKRFIELTDYLRPNDCLIFNNTRVMPARLFGQKASGGKIECLIERVLTDKLALSHVRASKSPKPGTLLHFGGGIEAEVTGRQNEFYLIALKTKTWFEVMAEAGELPLPPYMERSPEAQDAERYQTVYSNPLGAVAAPTAGLHFDDNLLTTIQEKGVSLGFLTLHVGAGTFLPIRAETIAEHTMHSEWAQVPQSVVDLIEKTRKQGGRVIAVGTTTVRSLETAALSGQLEPFHGDTNIFIYPGFKFKVIDAMITNFHLPKSTLMMLVSAFMGKDRIFSAYEHAVKERYRFFSYGDAMLLIPS